MKKSYYKKIPKIKDKLRRFLSKRIKNPKLALQKIIENLNNDSQKDL